MQYTYRNLDRLFYKIIYINIKADRTESLYSTLPLHWIYQKLSLSVVATNPVAEL